MKKALLALSFFIWISPAHAGTASNQMPVQHNGQVKSFESFARTTLELLSEKISWEGKSAVDVLFEKLAQPETLSSTPWIRVRYRPLLAKLGLPEERQYFSFDEINGSIDQIRGFVISAKAKRDKDERPSAIEQKAETVFSQWIEMKQLLSGRTLTVIPAAVGEHWISPLEVEGARVDAFRKILALKKSGDNAAFERECAAWNENVHQATQGRYRLKMKLEHFYYALSPFHWSWIFYLLSFICLLASGKNVAVKKAGFVFCAIAFLLHTAGLGLRIAILARPPVSNMYESMVYMNWILMLAALIFAGVKKIPAPITVGALASAVVMIYGELLPIDTSLDVLVPVLRSNYWLTIHVMTIVSSYGIFGLAMGLGHRHLWNETMQKTGFFSKKNWSKKEAEASAELIHRVIQVGALLLGIGTVLGGVWANESWGRFWGWDPKETWALITFLGYLIVIHLVYAKILKPYGLALSAVLGFLLVLMTWYGVNFVLGRGLHSYGQGSGGAVWIVYYLIAEALFLIFILSRRFLR